MKKDFLKSLTMVLFFLYGCTLWADGVLQYCITQEKVESAWVVDNKDGSYSVVIELKTPYKEEFAKLTKNNIGKKLQIIFQEQVLVQATIQDEIPSGIMTVGNWTSAEDAIKFIDTLNSNREK